MEWYTVKFIKLTEDLLLRLDASDDSASQSSLGQENSERTVLSHLGASQWFYIKRSEESYGGVK